MMKNDLIIEEQKILADFNKNAFKSVGSLTPQKKQYKVYAKNTLNKSKNINIRLSERDLQKIKIRSIEAGIPYQTLLTALIHQYVNKNIKIAF